MFVKSSEKHRNISKSLHLLFKLIVNFVKLKRREVTAQECAIHRFKTLGHSLRAAGVHVHVEVKLFEDGQVVVPELDGSIEHKPRLFGLLAQLYSLDNVMRKFSLLIVESLLLLVCEFTVILILVESNQLFVSDFYIRFEEVLDVTFSKLDVAC